MSDVMQALEQVRVWDHDFPPDSPAGWEADMKTQREAAVEKWAKSEKPDHQKDSWGSRVEAPPVADGFAVKTIGLAFEGPVLSRGEGTYGPYYVIKVRSGLGRVRAGDEETDIVPGMSLAVSEVNGLRPLAARVAKGPVEVKVKFLGKTGQAWDVELYIRDLF